MRAVVCTYARHDLAALAVSHLRRFCSGLSGITVLDASGTMPDCPGAEVRHVAFRRFTGPFAAMRTFPGEELLCIDDDVLLVAPISVGRYAAGVSKPLNGQMVLVRRHGEGHNRLSQARVRSAAQVEQYPWAAEAAKHQCELIDGVWLHIDRGSAGPNDAREALVAAMSRPRPGTELKSLLRKIGIVAKPGCSCNKRAQAMDEKGCDWCEENIDLIDSWLAEEAKRRKLPYLSVAGKALIRMAIRRARKKGNNV